MNRRGQRQPLSNEGTITETRPEARKERITLYITGTTAARLEQASADLDTSKNELINRAIIALLDEIDSD